MRMKLSFLLNVWYALSLDLSFDPLNPKPMTTIKLGVVPRYSILVLGERVSEL
ncbi:hypothetical protein V6Z11_D04G117600 [Gossypium hirsutum]